MGDPLRRLGFWIVWAGLSLASVAHAMTADEARRFADHLFQRGDYAGAALEYERALFLDPTYADRDAVRLQLSESYRQTKDPGKSIRILEDVLDRHDKAGSKHQAYYSLGRIYYDQKRYVLSETELTEAVSGNPASPFKEKIIYLQSLSRARQHRWEESALTLSGIGDPALTQKWEQHLRSGPKIRKKSPKVSGWLSALLPGSGHIYSGQVSDGIVSFLLNGIFITWTANAFAHHHDATGFVVGFMELGWYSGNIYSGIEAAHRYNRYQEKVFFDTLRGLDYPEEVRKDRKIRINLLSARF